MLKISVAPITMLSKEVTFKAEEVRSEVTENEQHIWICFELERSDTGESKRVCGLIDNTKEAMSSVELVSKGSVEDMWKFPRIKYNDPLKTDGFTTTIFHEREGD